MTGRIVRLLRDEWPCELFSLPASGAIMKGRGVCGFVALGALYRRRLPRRQEYLNEMMLARLRTVKPAMTAPAITPAEIRDE